MAAGREMAEHTIDHQELERSMTPENLSLWTADIERWERDTSQPNPFTVTAAGMH